MFYSFEMQENWAASMETESLHIWFTNSKERTGAHRYV